MVNLSKNGLIGEVDLRDSESGESIGTGFIERTKGGHVIVLVDLGKIPEFAEKGFSIGPISVAEDSKAE